MAYAAVASLSQTIDIVLNYHQHSISPQLKDLILSLQNHTVSLEIFFEDFPHKTYSWEEIIREVTEMAERVIELLLSDSLLKSTVGSSKPKVEASKYHLPYGITELQRVITEIESIVGEVKGERRSRAADGPDEELTEIISLLRRGSSSLQKIAIFGGRGTGKTTLARNAYNNPLIVDHFEVRAWSTVTSEYDQPRLFRELLLSMGAENVSSNTVDELIQSLYEKLHGKRYLIVVDDLWSFMDFRPLKYTMLYNDDRNGSRIIITTGNYFYIKIVDHIHKMCFMDEDRAWNLLREKLFKGDPCPSQLECVGKMIARRCRGHLLSIEFISRILAAVDQTEAAWEDIAENINIAASEDADTRLSRILSLSYTYLPHHLRPCFLYLGIWPEDEEIQVSKLIKLWVAEGFLNESESKSLEETGEEHVEDLVRRGLVSVSKRKYNGRIRSIKIGYHMWKMCLSQARVDNFIVRVSSYESRHGDKELRSCRRVRHLFGDDSSLESVYGSTIRTIMFYMGFQYHHRRQLGIVRWSIGNARLLRILDLSTAYNYDLPEEVFELIHLRYLAFHSGFSISEAISNLQNLQTLIICPREVLDDGIFDNLSGGIWRMPQLRHLLIFCFKLTTLKGATTTSALENLQTLTRVMDFVCSKESLEMIPNLKKLALLYTNNLRDYELHNLVSLQKLETLKIEMNQNFVEQQRMISCGFPPTLKKLCLSGVGFPWDDMEIIASLPNLEVLKLTRHSFMGETWETSEGGFSQLAYLLIDESNLEHWITETSHFPRLKSLVLHSCLHLLEVPNGIGQIPTLESIEMDGQNQSLLGSAKRMQEDRRSLGMNTFEFVLFKGTKILRRVSIIHSDLDFLFGSTIHTVICLDDRQQGKECSVIVDLIDAQEYFYKNDSSSTSLPDHLFELFHLRYLAFDYPFSIPAAISNLRNLQTLIIASNSHLKPVMLPVEIWRSPQLRHLLLASCVFPSEGAMIALESLQTLYKAVNFVCSKKILENIPNLKKLGISYKGDDEKIYERDYELSNLACLQRLEDLKIEVCNFPKEQQRLSPVFPITLKKLTLSGLGLPWEDFKIVGSLPNLQVLKLRDDACIGETWETADGGFCRLEFLLIDHSHFENWITESSHFPRLKFLVLYHCWRLVEIPEDIGEIPTLEFIEIDDCNDSLVDSAKTMEVYLDDMYGDSSVQVRFIKESRNILDDEPADQMLNDDF